jgi:hypothetical protein
MGCARPSLAADRRAATAREECAMAKYIYIEVYETIEM